MTTKPEPDRIRCLEEGPGTGPWNMAVDHALMDSARRGEVTLRFYRWAPPCLSLGRNQRARGRYDPEAADRRGVDVVRRPTGGRAVYHDRELTYALAAPADLWGGLRASYSRVNAALRRGLSRLGAPVGVAREREEGRAPGPGSRACFRDPLPGEVTAGGRKLVGSAQWREDGALLQQGSLLLADDQSVVEELRARELAGVGADPDGTAAAGRDGGLPAEADAEDGPGAAALREFLDPVPGFGRLADVLRDGFREEFGLAPVEGELREDERRRARELQERYEEGGWTWRR